MTLVVSAYWRDPVSGETKEFTDWSEGRHMAGAERARTELWGSTAIRRRGAKYLPLLAESDLWITPEDLDDFVVEVRELLHHLDDLRVELKRKADCALPHYLHNFLRAAEYAHAKGGGVNIT
ncbi:hypothetical protein [Stratiformator vulcanicus]|uniref:Uncharacterized protein n=1 Tax=Stratiformator vulcanicus TaxID=2527980 RepID=A0A517QXF5_9PLAN|nr:hypothetical protein [Stratiformator vulcanicus]QDT36335.1 hypothetical protein Pan189_06910 [Stratiformator vulcanicus]